MKRACLRNLLWIISLACLLSAQAEDWPSHRHDNSRSGITPDPLDVSRLKFKWVWRSPSQPQPAWAGPAREDAYAMIQKLGAMRDYDRAFCISSAGGLVFFGSSVDDAVHAVDLLTGREMWRFTTDAPVRMAPTISDGKAYVGADDGYAYCLDAQSGELIWRFSPVPETRRVLQNGKMISLYPCRTGVLIEGNVAYFVCGMLPWKKSYLCAVDANSGGETGEGHYVVEHKMTAEGAMLSSGDHLYVPQGRLSPIVFDRATGKNSNIKLKGGGGSFAVLSDDKRIFYGQDSRSSSISGGSKDSTFKGGRRLVIAGSTAFISTERSLSALERVSRKLRWKIDANCSDSMILAGGTLLAGGRDRVAALDSKSGSILWQAGVQGRVYDLAVVNGELLASTSEGIVYCFSPKGVGAIAPPPSREVLEVRSENPLALGPYVEHTGSNSASVRWETAGDVATKLDVRSSIWTAGLEVKAETSSGRQHNVVITGLRPDLDYTYTVKAGDKKEATFALDTFFNYSVAPVPGVQSTCRNESLKYSKGVTEAIKAARTDRGLCLMVGSRGGAMAWEIARQSRFKVICVDTDLEAVKKARQDLNEAGVYGSRVVVYHITSMDHLPFVGEFANLVVVNGKNIEHGEVVRLLKPGSGVAVSGGKTFIRPPLKDTGVWTHQYGKADNSAYGGETLRGAVKVDEFRVQWLGRPGPRYHPDRNGRKPAPLAVNGRMFGQGLERLVGIDAFNGSILWSLEMPPLRRFNMPRDCGNWCADADRLYVAVNDRCWVVNAADGDVVKTHSVAPGPLEGAAYEWGYIADAEDVIVGSTVRQGSVFRGFHGNASAGWYDARNGMVTHKICSDVVFAVEKHSGKRRWSYSGAGVVINSTITMADGVLYFVQCNNQTIVKGDSRRVGAPELWQDQFLVSLDVGSGRRMWQKPIDTADGTVMFSMAHGGGTLVVVASTNGKFHTTAFNANDGRELWTTASDWSGGKGDHGKAMSRPAIVEDKIYVRPAVLDLKTGALQESKMPDGGCGTYAFSKHAAFFRKSTVTVWPLEGSGVSSWARLRPGCWLSTVPALGLVLSPEGGGGCKCANWMETSIVFMPE